MGIKLVAADMDGTLLTDNKEITARTADTLRRLKQSGIEFCLCSGRPKVAMERYIQQLGFDVQLITYNGAEVIPSGSTEPIYTNTLDITAAEELFYLGMQLCGSAVAWESNRLIVGEYNEAVRQYNKLSNAKATLASDVDFRSLKLRKVLWIGSDPIVTEKLRIEMGERYRGVFNAATSNPIFLEFVNHDVSKGIALTRLCEHLNIDISESCAFGDGYNDIDMLKTAGVSVAMDNAVDEIKNLCDAVTLTNEQDGVAKYIEDNILKI